MNEQDQELLFDLLTKKAVYGLDEAEQNEVDRLDNGTAENEFSTLEMTVASIGLVEFDGEPMPLALFDRISADAPKHFQGAAATAPTPAAEPWPPVEPKIYTASDVFAPPARIPWYAWLGWAAAAVACIALAINISLNRSKTP